jgi:hypothetical protein
LLTASTQQSSLLNQTRFRDGTTGDRRCYLIFELLDFITRLAVLVPKTPRKPH